MLPSVNSKKVSALKRPNSGANRDFVSAHRSFTFINKDKPRLKTYGSDVIDRDIKKLEIRNTASTSQEAKVTLVPEHGITNTKSVTDSQSGSESGSEVQRDSFSCETNADNTTPWLVGVSCVAHNNVLCLDLNNERLKRFDSRYDNSASVEISSESNGMTFVSDTEIAVTCLNEVHFYNIGKFGVSRDSKHFRLAGVGYGISHNSNWFAVTCDITYDDSTARILDQDGNEQFLIESVEASGHSVRFSAYIQLDEMNERIFVSDAELPRIVCISFEGAPLWEHSINGGPKGIIMIESNLIVADQYGQTIEGFSTSGQHKRTLLTYDDGVCYPDYLAFCEKRRKLLVTYRGFGMVGVFDLQV